MKPPWRPWVFVRAFGIVIGRTWTLRRLGAAALLLVACASEDPEPTAQTSSTGALQTTGTPSDGSSTTSSAGDESASDDTTASNTSDPEASDTTEASGTGDTTAGGPDALPTPDGACPEFSTSVLDFSPAETETRQASVWFDPAAGGGGPLVFYWHGTGSGTNEALFGLGQEAVDEIVGLGGMVVAPISDPAAGQYPWFLVGGTEENDLHLMDEIVGCAAAGPGIDASRIHSLGMSAGGLQTSQASIRRASYIASVVVYSGGLFSDSVPSDAERPFAALIYHGGPDDVVVISFLESSARYESFVDDRGGYSLICDHGGGHVIPDSRNDSWKFLRDHPFGVSPYPYASGLPSWLPSYCVE